eukprot:SAG31_NODE_691_length_12779_cov_19.035095_8_plen_81_part_00
MQQLYKAVSGEEYPEMQSPPLRNNFKALDQLWTDQPDQVSWPWTLWRLSPRMGVPVHALHFRFRQSVFHYLRLQVRIKKR